MSILDEYARVNRRTPCPVCQSRDWCLLAKDGSTAICPRVFEGSIRTVGDAGYLHVLDAEKYKQARATEKVVVSEPPAIDAEFLSKTFEGSITDAMIDDQAAKLGVSSRSLVLLNIGWDVTNNAYTFPMRAASFDAIGIRLRRSDGFKWAISGSRNGLFIPRQAFYTSRPTLICEGPTDTAAMLTLGFQTIGRPFCRGGVDLLLEFYSNLGGEAVIVSDIDGPGVDGAKALADRLVSCVPTKIIRPLRGKDARAWLQSGATQQVVYEVIANAPVWARREAV